MGEDAKHVIMDVEGNYWEEDSKGMWSSKTMPTLPGITFSTLISTLGPIRIFRELT